MAFFTPEKISKVVEAGVTLVPEVKASKITTKAVQDFYSSFNIVDFPFDIIPESNLVRQYIDYKAGFTEVKVPLPLRFGEIIEVLSLITQGVIKFGATDSDDYELGSWSIILGPSGIIKTPSLNDCAKLIKDVTQGTGLNPRAPGLFSDVSLSQRLTEGLDHTIIIQDEVASFLGYSHEMGPSYKRPIVDLLLKAWSGHVEQRGFISGEDKLRKHYKGPISIKPSGVSHVSIYGATIPKMLLKNVTSDDVDSGYLPRFWWYLVNDNPENPLLVGGRFNAVRSQKEKKSGSSLKDIEDIKNKLNKLYKELLRIGNKGPAYRVNMFITDEEQQKWDQWLDHIEKLFCQNRNSPQAEGLKKLVMMTIKLAVYFTMVRPDFLEKLKVWETFADIEQSYLDVGLKQGDLKVEGGVISGLVPTPIKPRPSLEELSIAIGAEELSWARNIVESYFIPNYFQVLNKIQISMSDSYSDLIEVTLEINCNPGGIGGVYHTDLLRVLRANSKKGRGYSSSMAEEEIKKAQFGMLIMKQDPSKTRYIDGKADYFYIPSSNPVYTSEKVEVVE